MEQNLPEGLKRSVEFHGHLCGGLVVGYRAALAIQEELGIGRAEDEEVAAAVENDTCAVDALQVLLGCTFGKGNLFFSDYGKMAFTVWNRAKGRGVRISRRIGTRGMPVEEMLAMKTEDLFRIEPAAGEPPPQARIRDSEPCAACGEPTMVTRLVETARGKLCRPCSEAKPKAEGQRMS